MERKNVVITGARRGLGKVLAYVFASSGYNLIINDKEEIAKFILFLASNECSYLNGEVIKVDGGY